MRDTTRISSLFVCPISSWMRLSVDMREPSVGRCRADGPAVQALWSLRKYLIFFDQRQGEGGEGGDFAGGEADGQGFPSLRPKGPPVCHLQPVAAVVSGCPLYPSSWVSVSYRLSCLMFGVLFNDPCSDGVSEAS